MENFSIDSVNPSERISISFDNLCFSVCKPEKVDILKNLHGSFNPGRLCAIVGPSGAGKTSLLNIISGFKTPSCGSTLLVNGQKVSQSRIRKVSSYIEQNFMFLENLTVRETLNYAADFKLPSNTLKTTKICIIDNIVKLLGLEKCVNNYTQKLSGGERKRLAIGEELITNPPVMIFDEPTSGLDSVSTAQVIKHLMDLAHSGRTIICVIHQPSSYVLELFDDIYLLSDGQCIYNGAVVDIVPAFREAGFHCPQYYNRADFILEVASQQREGNLELLMSKTKDCVVNDQFSMNHNYASNGTLNSIAIGSKDDLQLIDSHTYQLSQWKQFLILLKRGFLSNRRNLITSHLKLIAHLFCGMLFGLTYYNVGNNAALVLPNTSLLFILMLTIFFCNSMPNVLFYQTEEQIFHREYLNKRYTLIPYFYAKVMAELPALFVGTMITLLPTYFLSDQPNDSFRISIICLIFVLLTINALFYGLAVGIICGAQIGVFFSSIFFLTMMIYSGYAMPYKELPPYLKPLCYFSFVRYYVEGLFQGIYGYERQNLNCKGFCYFKTTDRILQMLDMTENDYVIDFVGMVVSILIFKLISILAIKIKLNKLLK